MIWSAESLFSDISFLLSTVKEKKAVSEADRSPESKRKIKAVIKASIPLIVMGNNSTLKKLFNKKESGSKMNIIIVKQGIRS